MSKWGNGYNEYWTLFAENFSGSSLTIPSKYTEFIINDIEDGTKNYNSCFVILSQLSVGDRVISYASSGSYARLELTSIDSNVNYIFSTYYVGGTKMNIYVR